MTDTADAALVPDASDEVNDARPLSAEAWRSLRTKPMFWISATLIFVFVMMAAFPSIFTTLDPRESILSEARRGPSSEHWFGQDRQGYDLYTRCIYGARASILVGLTATIGTSVVGVTLGLIAGYMGGWIDALISRFAEIFFALPLLLGAIIILQSVSFGDTYFAIVGQVAAVLIVLGWPSIFRLMRSAVIQVKPQEYVQAARALGCSPLRIARSHILPNALGPVIVVSTINLGVFISAEAALSFLGIGLRPPTVSWGVMISDGAGAMQSAPHGLLFPSLFLSLAVLAFIMLGDAIRDAFDPKSK
ncbi:ABC transporter permease [Nocardioides sambongensis]|uniref:ABC transporter permease n=1 Tax=Nocardioides sambongensis TaxID=2589074 RepID=UPI0011272864|nr:ABC transporter permease [Nocardioides sambongensis]